MSAKRFLDTNIFIYCFDTRDLEKRTRALELIQEGLQTANTIVSTQVVQEFLNVATTKFATPLRMEDARDYLNSVMKPMCSVYPSIELYEEALGIRAQTGFGFYDSLIVAAALTAGCKELLTEDLQHGQVVRDMKIVNPFLSS